MRSVPFFLLALASLWVLYLGVRSEPPVNLPSTTHVHTPPAPAQSTSGSATSTVHFDNNAPGYAVYRARGCQTCHGMDALGSRMGPSLAEARLHYDRETLTAYLHDPSGVL
jgi:cytochrome c2